MQLILLTHKPFLNTLSLVGTISLKYDLNYFVNSSLFPFVRSDSGKTAVYAKLPLLRKALSKF